MLLPLGSPRRVVGELVQRKQALVASPGVNVSNDGSAWARKISAACRSGCLSGSSIGLPVSPSHSRAVLSEDAVTMRLPSG